MSEEEKVEEKTGKMHLGGRKTMESAMEPMCEREFEEGDYFLSDKPDESKAMLDEAVKKGNICSICMTMLQCQQESFKLGYAQGRQSVMQEMAQAQMKRDGQAGGKIITPSSFRRN